MSDDLFDLSAWPVVRAQYPAADLPGRMERWLGGFDALLARGAPFALVVALPDGVESEEVPEDRRAAAIWFKDRREALGQYCRALVYIVPDDVRRAAMAAQMEKFPLTVRLAADEAAAIVEARALTDG
jgi:hypothetical protein